jgi:hypothetical protein
MSGTGFGPRIIAAALRYNGVTLSMPPPARHATIMQQLPTRMRNVKPSDQGFVDERGHFVGRELGLAIARASGQLLKPTTHRELFSEDLW